MAELKISNDLQNVIKKVVLDTYFPVGSLYLTVGSENPNTTIGGTWTKLSGYYLYADTSVNNTSYTGKHTQSHILNANQIPAHNHGITVNSKTLTGNLNSMYGSSGVSPLRDNCRVDGVFSRNSTTTVNTPGYVATKGYGLHIDVSHNHTASSSNTGGGQGHAHNIATKGIYVWQRTK